MSTKVNKQEEKERVGNTMSARDTQQLPALGQWSLEEGPVLFDSETRVGRARERKGLLGRKRDWARSRTEQRKSVERAVSARNSITTLAV